MSSFFNSNLKGDVNVSEDNWNGVGVHGVYDKKHSRVLYTFLDYHENLITTGVCGSPTIVANFVPHNLQPGDTVLIENISSGVGGSFTVDYIQSNASFVLTGDPGSLIWGNVTITYLNKWSQHTLSYNEMLDKFESFHSYTPSAYINIDDKVLSINYDTLQNEAYEHDASYYGVFYGGSTEPSYITIVSNPDLDVNKAFNNIEFASEVYNAGVLVDPAETIDSIQVWHPGQDTGAVTLTPGTNMSHRLNVWRLRVPRDSTSGGRIRNHWVYVKLSYDNNTAGLYTNDKQLVLHDIYTKYLINVQ